MQRKTLIFLIFIIQASIGKSQNPYQIKSCKIDFVFSNGLQKGTKTLIFSDSGKIEKESGITYVDTSANSEIPRQFIGSRTVYNSLIIHTKDSVFAIDMDSKTGTSSFRFTLVESSHQDEPVKKTGKNTFDIDLLALQKNAAKKVGEDTFLNKKCDVIDLDGAKIWYWKGIALKKESLSGQIYEYATSIDENYVIKENEFKVPDNIKIN